MFTYARFPKSSDVTNTSHAYLVQYKSQTQPATSFASLFSPSNQHTAPILTMQIPTFLPLVLWALNLAAANPLYPTDFCYADNCARAVTGTASVGALVGGGALRTVRAILDCSAALQPILTIMVNPPTP